MLSDSGLAPKFPEFEALCSQYPAWIGRTRIGRPHGFVSYWAAGFKDAYLLPFLCLALNFFPDKMEWYSIASIGRRCNSPFV